MITATSILKIDAPEKLFSGPDAVKKEYKTFAKMFHPDLNRHLASDALKAIEEAFKKLNELHAEAVAKINRNEWMFPGRFDFRRKSNGNLCQFHFVKEFENGICKAYIGKNNLVAYIFAKDLKDLVNNAVKVLEGCKKQMIQSSKVLQQLCQKLLT